MKVIVSTAEGMVLDWLVAKCEKEEVEIFPDMLNRKELMQGESYVYSPSTDWSQGGPIIERAGIDLYCNLVGRPAHADPSWRRSSWRARICSMGRTCEACHSSHPLVAAMRCYVAYQLGTEVTVPASLV
jgi:hypothetical protein